MYALHVFFNGSDTPSHIEYPSNAGQALARIPALLAEHHGCEKIMVYNGETRLFSVDCHGNTTPG